MSTGEERRAGGDPARTDQPDADERGRHNELGFRDVDEEGEHDEAPGPQDPSHPPTP